MKGYRVYYNRFSSIRGKRTIQQCYTYVYKKEILNELIEMWNQQFTPDASIHYRYWIGSINKIVNEKAVLSDVPLFEIIWYENLSSEVNFGSLTN